MNSKAMSAVRFSELVKRYGRPEIKFLWTRPEEDSGFMKAVKRGKVVTLSQEPSTKRKDYGEIGFCQEPHAAYLVFPKPLAESKGGKIVGIKYDLIGEPTIKDPVSSRKLKKAPAKRVRSKPPTVEVIPSFDIRVRQTAVLEKTVRVEAKTKAEAAKRAAKISEEHSFDLSKAVVKTEVIAE